jgi:predicted PurR-regulated permease PerM
MENNSKTQPMITAPQFPDRGLAPAALAVVIVLGISVCAFMARPFLGALVWSTTLAVLFAPFDIALSKVLGSRSLSALITAMVTACIVVVPAILVAGTLLNEAARSAAIVVPMFDAEDWTRVMGEHRWLLAVTLTLVQIWRGRAATPIDAQPKRRDAVQRP